MVRRIWDGVVRGGYVTHGETYYRPDEQIWWSKGGELVGEATERIAFLRHILADAPGGILDPILPAEDVPKAGVPGEYLLYYLGASQALWRTITMPHGTGYHVDVIDTWNMTIRRQPGMHAGTIRVDLPAREYMAIRITVARSER